MDLRQCLLTENACYKSKQSLYLKGIMWHSTGCNNPNLKRYVAPDDGKLGTNAYGNHWNQYKPGGQFICCHAFIGLDKNGNVCTYQTLPFNINGWHCGGDGNSNYIGFEICEDDLTNKDYFNKVYKEACEFTAYLCKEFNLDPMGKNVIICHNDGYKLGIASGHGDVYHWFSRYGKTMDDVRKDVAAIMGKATTPTPNIPAQEKLYRVRKSWTDVASQIGAYRSLDSAKSICKEGYFVFDETGKAVYPEVKAEPVVTKTYCNPKIRTLKKGDKGEAVKALQIMLVALGYSVGSTGADSDFGTATETAVKKFQSDNKLTSDGVAGADTWSTLIAKL